MTKAPDHRIREVYQAALQLPADQRAAFVAAQSAGDHALYESVTLLLARQEATRFSDAPSGPPPEPEPSPGTVVGDYRIEAVLGRGGMGVVYRAVDLKLHRPVALKFLSSASADPKARQRFQQEAEAASALNHPHIAAVYAIGEHAERQYLVGEYVDGGTLEDWLAAAPRRHWRQSVELLAGVADAIAAAHDAGILHRDVKPANILIDGNGYAKLADFGLAKLLEHGAARRAPIEQRHETQAGVVIGTVAYMSPEQATGQPLDARSDIFSFGIVLYEVLAGRRPFEAATDLEVLKSIVHADPEPLPNDVPELVRNAVERALEKNPAERYQSMRELAIELKRAARKGATGTNRTASPAPPQRRARFVWPAAAAAFAIAFAVALFPVLRDRQSPPETALPMRFTMAAPGFVNDLRISPDSRHVAYVANVDGRRQIWLRPIDALEAHTLPGTDGALRLFWSADSRSIAFTVGDQLRRIDIGGGAAQTLVPNGVLPLPGYWGPDGTILFTRSSGGGIGSIHRVSALGGELTELTTVDRANGEFGHILPQVSADGRLLAYVVLTTGTDVLQARLAIRDANLQGAAASIVELGPATPGNAPQPPVLHGNSVLYVQDGQLLMQRFDPAAKTVAGLPVTIAGNVAEFSLSGTGTLVHVARSAAVPTDGFRRLAWFNRAGERLGTVEAAPDVHNPRLSPSGDRVAYNNAPGALASEIWTVDLPDGPPTRRTFEPANFNPVWSPDGTRIVFSSTRNAGVFPAALYERAANGTGTDRLLLRGESQEFLVPSDWSADGRILLFGRTHETTMRSVSNIWMLRIDGDPMPVPVLESASVKAGARLSPDGRWLAYSTNESGTRQVVVQPFPAVNEGKWQVSRNGGIEPKWRSDGRELFYLALDGTLMAVDVMDGDGFRTAAPRPLFNLGVTVAPVVLETFYDVTPDGQRFVVNEQVSSAAPAEGDGPLVTVVLNWPGPEDAAAR